MKTTTQTVFEGANAMLAPTWRFLHMNETDITVPEALDTVALVDIVLPDHAQGEANAFDKALAALQTEWEKQHPAPTSEEVAQREAALAAEADATYGGTAQSGYQMNAQALEDARSLSMAFEHGTGEEAAAWLRMAAGDAVVLNASAGDTVDALVAVHAREGVASAAAVDVIAGAASTVTLSLVVDMAQDAVDKSDCSAQGKDPDAALEQQDKAALKQQTDVVPEQQALTGTTVRVLAFPGAHVTIVRTQAADDSVLDIDDFALLAADNAFISIRQTVLGAGAAYTGLGGDLRGAGSRIDVDTRYVGRKRQKRDFNYLIRHHGEKSQSLLTANGVLAGSADKTLRGTIDLIRGAKGAEGQETETVLLVDEGVHNRTVPVILCSEDDVAGNHGATIGHIRPEQLFYLASRGLSADAAEQLFASALLEQAVIDAPEETARTAVLRLGEKVTPGFSALFSEEA